MKISNKKEFEEYTTNCRGTISQRLETLKVGEGFAILDSEYKYKSTVSVYVNNMFKNPVRKFKTRRLKTGDGWGILRVK